MLNDDMLASVRRGIRDARVVDAMAAVPRERFVPEALRGRAYDDCALPIGEHQTISQPYIVALMTAALALDPGDRVLEVGTGSGYQAAVLSRLAREVITVERQPRLLERARDLLATLGYAKVGVYPAGARLGRAEAGPYNAIIVTAAAPRVPRSLIDQLAAGGRLIVPVGSLREQELLLAAKTPRGVALARLGACRFVPLVGEEGFDAPLIAADSDASIRIKLR